MLLVANTCAVTTYVTVRSWLVTQPLGHLDTQPLSDAKFTVYYSNSNSHSSQTMSGVGYGIEFYWVVRDRFYLTYYTIGTALVRVNVSQSASQSASQSVSPSVSQAVKQSASQPACQPVSQSVSQSAS